MLGVFGVAHVSMLRVMGPRYLAWSGPEVAAIREVLEWD